MKRKLFFLILILFVLIIDNTAFTVAEGNNFSFNGAKWGMPKEEVRSLFDVQPGAEPEGNQPGQTGLIYLTKIKGYSVLIQFCFLTDIGLYNIEFMGIEDGEKELYDLLRDSFTEEYGVPISVAEIDECNSDDPAAQMILFFMNSTSDTDYLGWNADPETVIIMSREENFHTTYVEMRAYKYFFDGTIQ